MYEELVKRLRDYEESGLSAISPYEAGEIADAIEGLSKYADTMRKLKCEGWHLQQTKYHDGYQAVATMSLPQPPKEE